MNAKVAIHYKQKKNHSYNNKKRGYFVFKSPTLKIIHATLKCYA